MDIQYSFIGMDSSDALKDFASEKILKYSKFLDKATSVVVDFKDSSKTKGVKADFILDIRVALPGSFIQVEEKGADMYAIVGKAADILGRRLKKYNEKKDDTEVVLVPEEEVTEEVTDEYISYTPKISKRVKVEDMTPMPEASAIEKMELDQQRQILFKNSDTGNISMIYKDENNEYILVEFANGL